MLAPPKLNRGAEYDTVAWIKNHFLSCARTLRGTVFLGACFVLLFSLNTTFQQSAVMKTVTQNVDDRFVQNRLERLLLDAEDQVRDLKRLTGNETTSITEADFCNEPSNPPFPYEDCMDRTVAVELTLGPGNGAGSTLNSLVDGIVWAYAHGYCVTINEKRSKLRLRSDPEQFETSSFLKQYFEPIGLPADHERIKDHKTFEIVLLNDDDPAPRFWREIPEKVSFLNMKYAHMDRHLFRYIMLKRILRFRPEVREKICSDLHKAGITGKEPYMAFSVRRGDKITLEKQELSPMSTYISMAKEGIDKFFDGKPPTIFVATDDCTVMEELRQSEPTWKFASLCDVLHDVKGMGGFNILELSKWTQEELDGHLLKFFAEVIGMTSSKYLIAYSQTNVANFVWSLRKEPGLDSVHYVDKGGEKLKWILTNFF